MSVRRVVITDDETPAVDAPRGRDNRRGRTHRFVYDEAQPAFPAGEDLLPYNERPPRRSSVAPWISKQRAEFERLRKDGKVSMSESLFERAVAGGTPRR